MKFVLYISLVIASCLSHAQSTIASLPARTMFVNALTASDNPREGFTRLRLSLTSNENSLNELVRIAGAAVCTTSICYEFSVPSSVKVSNSSAGTSAMLTELEVPYSEIVAVRFKFVGGGGVLHGNIALSQSLKLGRDFRGGDVMVVLQKRPQGAASYEPIAASANYFQPEGTSVYYNPKFATTIKLPHGTSILIPANAYHLPQIFIVAVHDAGDEYPLIDIYPLVQLAKPATIAVSSILRNQRAVTSDQHQPTPALKSASPGGLIPSQSRVVSSSTSISFEIFSTGVIHKTAPVPITKQPTSSLTPADSNTSGVMAAATVCNAAGWCNCADQLAYPINQQIWFNGMAPTGTVYLDWCTTIPPYVHISMSNLGDARERFTVKHENKVAIANGALANWLPLKRIETWASFTQAMVNGFVWGGDFGLLAGGYGAAKGHVHDFGFGLGDNLVDPGGSCTDYPSPPYAPCGAFGSGTNQRVMLVPPAGIGFSWQDNNTGGIISNAHSYVSSTTSIVKGGVCAADGLVNRWSAVGTTSGGRIIFISSTSSGTTSAAELCPVFQAMGVFNAIRLDGGPSAALAIDGVLKNPLSGLDFVKFGRARYVPYALKISYPGW